MNYRASDEYEVLIVGGGPAGLTAAIALARAGLRVLLAERRTRSSHPRATVISVRAMELFRSWGLEDEIRAGGNEVELVGWQSETLAAVAAGYPWHGGYPTREQSAVASPTYPACVPQDHLEPVLMRHLRSLPAVRVELGTEVTEVDARADRVEAVLRPAGGRARPVTARYLLAADGANSRMRALLRIAMPVADSLEHAVTALFRAPLWERLGEYRYGIYSVGAPDAPSTFLPAGGDRWIYGERFDPAGGSPARLTERLAAGIRTGSGFDDLNPLIESTGVFSFQAGVADTFRRGRAFLVGDAAHRVTPRGGTGMNMAILSAFDLAWKLAWVLRGWAAPELLDSYERERRAVARHNAERSADTEGSVRDVGSELHVDLGGRIPHLWTDRNGARVSTVDLLTPGLTLFTGPDGDWDRVAGGAAGRPPVTVRRLDALAARGLGLTHGAALLVGPDGMTTAWLAGADERSRAMAAGAPAPMATVRRE